MASLSVDIPNINHILFIAVNSKNTGRAQVQSKKITTLEKRQFIHVLKALKQGLKVQEKDDFLAFGVN